MRAILPFSTTISWLRSTWPLPSMMVVVLIVTDWAPARVAILASIQRKRKLKPFFSTVDIAYSKTTGKSSVEVFLRPFKFLLAFQNKLVYSDIQFNLFE